MGLASLLLLLRPPLLPLLLLLLLPPLLPLLLPPLLPSCGLALASVRQPTLPALAWVPLSRLGDLTVNLGVPLPASCLSCPGSDPRQAYGDLAGRGVKGVVLEAFGTANMPNAASAGW